MAKKLLTLWKKYGFYAAVAGCVLLLGAGAWGLRNMSAPMPSPTTRPAAANPDYLQSLKEAQVTPTPTPEPAPSLRWPLQQASVTILTQHDIETPVWSQVLAQWSVHYGVDLEGIRGEAVMAAADGTVSAIYEDVQLGSVVAIEHDLGYVTRYASLGAVAVDVGERVRQGDVIGSIGQSAGAESAMPPHLHFEVERHGIAVDPASMIKD